MAHTHEHGPAQYSTAFPIGVALNVAFVITEIIFGRLSNSVALVADAGHNLGDVLGLVLAWGASIVAQRQPSERRTYGMRRTTILAALINAVVLLIAIGGIAWEAILRFSQPEPVTGSTVIWVAVAGILINGFTALLFLSGRKGDLNIRGAFLHMAADAGVSLGVVVAGVAILVTGWVWLDPVVSLGIVVVILVSTWGLLKDSVNLALDAVPETIDLLGVQQYLARLPGVTEVHDLHIWGMSTTETALTAHLTIPEASFTDVFLNQTANELHDRYGIEHTTLQVETGDPEQRCHNCGPMKMARKR